MNILAKAALAAATVATLVGAPAAPAAHADGAGSVGSARGVADPVVGQCHQLTFAQVGAQAEPRPAVPCTGRHNTRTIRVARLPRGLAYRDAQPFSYRTCQTALEAKAGAGAIVLAKSTVSYAFFYPTKAEQRAGSRYVRCDIAVYNGRSLAPLVGAKAPTLANGLPEKYRRCNNGNLTFFICTRPHRNRATDSFTIPGRKYPGEKAVTRIAFDRCEKLTKDLGYVYYPLATTWASGKHEVACLEATAS